MPGEPFEFKIIFCNVLNEVKVIWVQKVKHAGGGLHRAWARNQEVRGGVTQCFLFGDRFILLRINKLANYKMEVSEDDFIK